MSNKFEKGDEVVIDGYNIPYSPIDITSYNGKLGIIEGYNYFLYSYCYKVNIEGVEIFLYEDMLKPKPTEEESLRELLIKNKEVLLGNRKAIDKSLELIETMLNK